MAKGGKKPQGTSYVLVWRDLEDNLKLKIKVRCRIVCHHGVKWVSQVAEWKTTHLPMQWTLVRSLGQEDPLEEEIATHSSILAWKIPWAAEPDGLQSMGSQRFRHD